MPRVILGAAIAAVAMLVIGFIFWATPLARLAHSSVDDAQAASVQQALAATLPKTGTYSIPGVDTPAQTNMYSRGPIATIHYNLKGFAANDAAALAYGLAFNFVVALLIGLAMFGIDRRVPDFRSRAKVAATIAIAAAAFSHLGDPIYFHHDWGHAIFRFIADAVTLAVAAIIIARFLPHPRIAAPSDAPTDV